MCLKFRGSVQPAPQSRPLNTRNTVTCNEYYKPVNAHYPSREVICWPMGHLEGRYVAPG